MSVLLLPEQGAHCRQKPECTQVPIHAVLTGPGVSETSGLLWVGGRGGHTHDWQLLSGAPDSVLTKNSKSGPGGTRFPEGQSGSGLSKGLALTPALWLRLRLQALQVLWQGVLLDVFLNVPAREMSLQVLLHHEVQSGLAKDRMNCL